MSPRGATWAAVAGIAAFVAVHYLIFTTRWMIYVVGGVVGVIFGGMMLVLVCDGLRCTFMKGTPAYEERCAARHGSAKPLGGRFPHPSPDAADSRLLGSEKRL